MLPFGKMLVFGTNRLIKLGAIDASMRNVGLAFGTYDLGTADYNVDEVHLIQTFPSKEKGVRKSSLDYQSGREMYTKLQSFLNYFNPAIMFAEMPIGSQSANGMKSYGMTLQLLGTIAVPVIQVSPQEVKVAAVDSKNASKDTMIKWAAKKWPDVQWLTRKIKGEIELLNKNEHMADACGAIEAGMRTDQWAQLLSVLLTQQPAVPLAESGL